VVDSFVRNCSSCDRSGDHFRPVSNAENYIVKTLVTSLLQSHEHPMNMCRSTPSSRRHGLSLGFWLLRRLFVDASSYTLAGLLFGTFYTWDFNPPATKSLGLFR
jgi:hypothetical protein